MLGNFNSDSGLWTHTASASPTFFAYSNFINWNLNEMNVLFIWMYAFLLQWKSALSDFISRFFHLVFWYYRSRYEIVWYHHCVIYDLNFRNVRCCYFDGFWINSHMMKWFQMCINQSPWTWTVWLQQSNINNWRTFGVFCCRDPPAHGRLVVMKT